MPSALPNLKIRLRRTTATHKNNSLLSLGKNERTYSLALAEVRRTVAIDGFVGVADDNKVVVDALGTDKSFGGAVAAAKHAPSSAQSPEAPAHCLKILQIILALESLTSWYISV